MIDIVLHVTLLYIRNHSVKTPKQKQENHNVHLLSQSRIVQQSEWCSVHRNKHYVSSVTNHGFLLHCKKLWRSNTYKRVQQHCTPSLQTFQKHNLNMSNSHFPLLILGVIICLGLHNFFYTHHWSNIYLWNFFRWYGYTCLFQGKTWEISYNYHVTRDQHTGAKCNTNWKNVIKLSNVRVAHSYNCAVWALHKCLEGIHRHILIYS